MRLFLVASPGSNMSWCKAVEAGSVNEFVDGTGVLEIVGHSAETKEEIEKLAAELQDLWGRELEREEPPELSTWLEDLGYHMNWLSGYQSPRDSLVFHEKYQQFSNLTNEGSFLAYWDHKSDEFLDVESSVEVSDICVQLYEQSGFGLVTEGGPFDSLFDSLKVYRVHTFDESPVQERLLLVRRMWPVDEPDFIFETDDRLRFHYKLPDALVVTDRELPDYLRSFGIELDPEEYMPAIRTL